MHVPEMHRAAKADRAFLRWRARRAREAGAVAYVVPHTGYGSTDWLRVLGRVLLTRDPARPATEPTGLRGWRNFVNVPVENATVMVTALPRPFLAAWHTFVVNEHARATTPGMPVLYERLTQQHPGAPVVYLSTGAWNVAPSLTRFLSRNLYPAGALLLTDWGPTADRWFRSGREHKRTMLERLALEFPNIKWLLIGDDGQHDESIYSDFLSVHPDNVAAVCIRQLSPGEAVLAGSTLRDRSPADGSPVPWLYAPDGAGLGGKLGGIGFLDPAP